MKITYHSHVTPPWNRAFEALLQVPQSLKAYVDVTHLEELPDDLGHWTQTKIPRTQVLEILKSHSAGPVTSLEALEREECLVVITGQQPGLGGGPLFLLYKILTAIQAAERLSEARSIPVIPMYCCGSDDHDWSEANRYFRWQEGKWERRTMADEPSGAHLFEKHYPENLESCRDILGLDATSGFESFFEPKKNFAANQINFIQKIFQGSSLVVFEPRWFRSLASEFNSQIFHFNEAIDQDLLMAGSALKLAQYPETFKIHEGAQLCFSREGRRERLKLVDGQKWGGRHTVLGSKKEVEKLIENKPDMWSPNVVSRPIWMRHLFPIVADVVGPSETAYQLQLQGVYRRFQVAAPLLVPRLTATLLRRREIRKLRAIDKKPWELETKLDSSLNPNFREGMTDRIQGIGNLLKNLQENLVKEYPEIKNKLSKNHERIGRDLKKIPQMIEKAHDIRSGDRMSQWESVKAWCQPEGVPQERRASFLSMNEALKGSWFETFRKTVDCLRRAPAWVELEEEDDAN